MAKSVHVLSQDEHDQMLAGLPLNCRWHEHVSAEEAREMVLDGQLYPWMEKDDFEPVAHYAQTADGKESRKHIVLTVAREWRKVTNRSPIGAAFISSMQLVSIAGRGR